ncbi:PTS fructose transporter subunit IIB [Clostridium ganghwense]|uniref:Fructose PTS transporter subunit IIB n=1 Tax=Clostridium ganghwense TaxID=312089 RepID=A0ABT4CPT5_9CLOT|nr:fructose PTS transporter subunit IIB [Clostridium ganghwense]MCY6371065.1 fructose PTS transporter subunit IIB [Clostridium ganghwense]
MKKVVGICACPTGIAHTYMAADAIEAAAKKLGCKCKVETQGSIGIEEKLSEEDIKEADLIIVSAAVKLREFERFQGYEDKILEVPLQTAIAKMDKILAEKL